LNNENIREDELKINLFWTLIIFISFNLFASIGLFLRLITDLLTFILVIIAFNITAIILSFIGISKAKQLKGGISPDTKLAILLRKLFNIVGGLITIATCWFLGSWLTFFVLAGILLAFILHKILYVKFKIKTIFTNTILALGRDTGPDKVFWPTITALSSFSFTIGFISLIFQNYFGPNFWPQFFIISTAVILIWGVGDSSAYYIGSNFGIKKLPYNKNKTYIGTFRFFIVSSIVALIILSPFMEIFIEITPVLFNNLNWIWSSFVSAFIGALTESLNIKINDNFTIPFIESIILVILVIFF